MRGYANEIYEALDLILKEWPKIFKERQGVISLKMVGESFNLTQENVNELLKDLEVDVRNSPREDAKPEESNARGCPKICVNGHRGKLRYFPTTINFGGNYGDTTRVVGGVVKRL